MNRKQRVLLIEDDPKQADVYARIITHDGFEVDVAYNADDAAKCLDEKVYDAAVVDMVLSGIEGDTSGGEQVLAHARKVEEPPALVVFTSIDKPQFAADTIQEWGVARFLSKGEVIAHGSEPLLHGLKSALAPAKPTRDRRKEILRALRGSELEEIWIDGALRTLKPDGGYTGLVAFLVKLFSDLTPLLPRREAAGFRIGEELGHVVGRLWSKGLGAPIFVDIASLRNKTDALRVPYAYASGESIDATVRECEDSGLQGTVWQLSGSARSSYGS